jgi:hypothetical protein
MRAVSTRAKTPLICTMASLPVGVGSVITVFTSKTPSLPTTPASTIAPSVMMRTMETTAS